jgi:hypothetical protein
MVTRRNGLGRPAFVAAAMIGPPSGEWTVPPDLLRTESALSQAAIHYIPVRRPDRIACAPVLFTTVEKLQSDEQCRRLRTVAIAGGATGRRMNSVIML